MGCACGTSDKTRLVDATQQVEELGRKLRESEQKVSELHTKLVRVETASQRLPVVPTIAPDEPLLPDAGNRRQQPSGGTSDGEGPAPAKVPCFVADVAASKGDPLLPGRDPPGRAPLPGGVSDSDGDPGDTKEQDQCECSSTRDDKQPESVHAAGHETAAPLTEDLPPLVPAYSDRLAGSGDAPSQSSGFEEESVGPAGCAQQSSEGGKGAGEGVEDVPPVEETALEVGGISSNPSTCTLAAAAACWQCGAENVPTFTDDADECRYCEQCWKEYYSSVRGFDSVPLVTVHTGMAWPDDRLAQDWAHNPLVGWPPQLLAAAQPHREASGQQAWSEVAVLVRREVVGPHSRDLHYAEQLQPGEVMAQRYAIRTLLGEGHFTKAYLAGDLQTGASVCLKRHRNLNVEGLADLISLSRRMEEVDPEGQVFPRHLDAFYDLAGYTVESLIEGRNCLCASLADACFFESLDNLRVVARDALRALTLLDRAGIVHCDVKPDNLIWVEGAGPVVRIVDFGCSRLDAREEPGRNWSLAEGGAGHLGKWPPEMALRLPISTRADVWGVAVSLCELHCGRRVWRSENDTAELVVAQAIGLCGCEDGLPSSLLSRSPLDIRLLYTPAPRHFPLQRNRAGVLEMLMPNRYGLEQVIGENWQKQAKRHFGDLLAAALVLDPWQRPSAEHLLQSCAFLQCLQAHQNPIVEIKLEVNSVVEEA